MPARAHLLQVEGVEVKARGAHRNELLAHLRAVLNAERLDRLLVILIHHHET